MTDIHVLRGGSLVTWISPAPLLPLGAAHCASFVSASAKGDDVLTADVRASRPAIPPDFLSSPLSASVQLEPSYLVCCVVVEMRGEGGMQGRVQRHSTVTESTNTTSTTSITTTNNDRLPTTAAW